jgi:hypothetical protein
MMTTTHKCNYTDNRIILQEKNITTDPKKNTRKKQIEKKRTRKTETKIIH